MLSDKLCIKAHLDHILNRKNHDKIGFHHPVSKIQEQGICPVLIPMAEKIENILSDLNSHNNEKSDCLLLP